MFEDVVNAIRDVGFPIFISVFVLVRLEKKLDNVIDAINGQKEKG